MNPISNIIKDSLNVVSPSWPLHSFVGVNPFWNLKEKPFYLTLSELSCINGENLFLPINYFLDKYNNGVITYHDIKKSIELLNHFNIKYNQDIQSFLRESLEEQEHLLSFNTYSEFLGNLENINVKEIIVLLILTLVKLLLVLTIPKKDFILSGKNLLFTIKQFLI